MDRWIDAGAVSSSMAGVVGVPSEDCTGAVELFGENEAGEFVGHGDWAKRQAEVGLGKSWFGPSVGWPDGEDSCFPLGSSRMDRAGTRVCCLPSQARKADSVTKASDWMAL